MVRQLKLFDGKNIESLKNIEIIKTIDLSVGLSLSTPLWIDRYALRRLYYCNPTIVLSWFLPIYMVAIDRRDGYYY